MRKFALVAAFLPVLFCPMQRAGATTITSSTFSGWQSTLSGSPTEANFSSIQYSSYSTSQGITLGAIGNSSLQSVITGPDGSGWSLTGMNYSGVVSLEGGSDSNAQIQIALPSGGENAVLVSLATLNGNSMTLTMSDGETFTASKGLLGFSISHPISWLTVTTVSGDRAILDDLWYGSSSLTQDGSGTGGSGSGTSSPAPEAATLLLTAGGLFVLIGAIRRASGRTREVPA